MLRFLTLGFVLTSVACGGSATTSTNASNTGDSNSTSGSEQSSDTQRPRDPVSLGPVVIAVPLPGVPRGELRVELQQLWTAVEQAAAITAPEPPAASSDDAIAQWVAGPFTAWIRQRVEATRAADEIAVHLTDLTMTERGLATALIAFAFEDMAASARGAPVPDWIAADPELVRVYAETIDRALVPVAQFSAIGYEGCSRAFQQANDVAWNEWAPFCSGHLEDLREVFGRYARREETQPAP